MNEGKKNNKFLYIIIIILCIMIFVLGGYIIYKNFIMNDRTTENDTNEKIDEEKDNTTISTNDFTYQNYNLKLTNKLNNIDKIYAIDVKSDDKINYDLYVRYTDESIVNIATIKINNSSDFEYRTLDVENNKLYFIIKSKNDGIIFELNYLDFNNLTLGAKTIDDFNKIFIKDNLWERGSSEKSAIYSSQIYVKNNDIYYTSFNDKSLKKYNMQSKEQSTVLNDIVWFDYFIDKYNNKIFYLTNNKFYLSDLDGEDAIELDNSLYSGSEFWTKAFYNRLPLFEEIVEEELYGYSSVNLYTYDYSSKSFEKIKENIYNNYTVKYNKIETNSSEGQEEYLIRTFFINR